MNILDKFRIGLGFASGLSNHVEFPTLRLSVQMHETDGYKCHVWIMHSLGGPRVISGAFGAVQ